MAYGESIQYQDRENVLFGFAGAPTFLNPNHM